MPIPPLTLAVHTGGVPTTVRRPGVKAKNPASLSGWCCAAGVPCA